jgi:hypothetical protein
MPGECAMLRGMRHGSRSRNRYDALQPRDERTWLVVKSMAGELRDGESCYASQQIRVPRGSASPGLHTPIVPKYERVLLTYPAVAVADMAPLCSP